MRYINLICLLFIFADQVFIDPTFLGIFVCGPLQSFVVNVCAILESFSFADADVVRQTKD